jgi:hypothetical protein
MQDRSKEVGPVYTDLLFQKKVPEKGSRKRFQKKFPEKGSI